MGACRMPDHAVEPAPGALSPWSAAAIQPPARWYCVESLPGAERTARDRLQAQDFTAYLPLYGVKVRHQCRRAEARIVVRPLFPGYLFVAFDRERDQWRPIASTRGVKRLFGTTPELPTPLPDAAMALMLRTASLQSVVPQATLEALEAGKITPAQAAAALDVPSRSPQPPLTPGTTIRIITGPLAGSSATVKWSDSRRVAVLFGLLGQRSLSMPRAAVEPC